MAHIESETLTEVSDQPLIRYETSHVGCAAGLCPHCGKLASRPFLNALAYNGLERVDYERCEACGVVHLRTPPRNDSFYKKDESGANTPNADFLKYHLEVGCGVDFMLMALDNLLTESDTSFASIGCGAGVDLDIARLLYPRLNRIKGYEPFHYGKSEDLNVDVEAQLFGSSPQDKPFDALLALEVIEHVEDARSFLRSLRAGLAPTGRLLLTTPNAEQVTEDKNIGTAYQCLFAGEHRILYTAETLSRLLQEAGFGHVNVHSHSLNLVCVASEFPLPQQHLRPLLAERLLEYLTLSVSSIPRTSRSAFAAGQVFRSLSELSAKGRATDMLAVLRSTQALSDIIEWADDTPRLTSEAIRSALACSTHARYTREHRTFLGPLAFHLGMLACMQGKFSAACDQLTNAIHLIRHEYALSGVLYGLSHSFITPCAHELLKAGARSGNLKAMALAWEVLLGTEPYSIATQSWLSQLSAQVRQATTLEVHASTRKLQRRWIESGMQSKYRLICSLLMSKTRAPTKSALALGLIRQ